MADQPNIDGKWYEDIPAKVRQGLDSQPVSEEKLYRDTEGLVQHIKTRAKNVMEQGNSSTEEQICGSFIRSVVTSKEFNLATLALLFLSALVLGLQTVINNVALDVFGHSLAVIFLVEVTLRIIGSWPRPLGYLHSPFNCLDVCVAVMVLTNLIVLMSRSKMWHTSDEWFLALRWLRIFRLYKQSTVSTRLGVLVTALGSACLSTLWPMLLLLLVIMYVYGCIGCLTFQRNDPYYWGDLGKSMTTLCQMATLDSVSQILYISAYGCSKYYPAHLAQQGICNHSEGKPITAIVFIFSFVCLAYTIVLNMVVFIVLCAYRSSLSTVGKMPRNPSSIDKSSTYENTTRLIRILQKKLALNTNHLDSLRYQQKKHSSNFGV